MCPERRRVGSYGPQTGRGKGYYPSARLCAYSPRYACTPTGHITLFCFDMSRFCIGQKVVAHELERVCPTSIRRAHTRRIQQPLWLASRWEGSCATCCCLIQICHDSLVSHLFPGETNVARTSRQVSKPGSDAREGSIIRISRPSVSHAGQPFVRVYFARAPLSLSPITVK